MGRSRVRVGEENRKVEVIRRESQGKWKNKLENSRFGEILA